MSIRPIDFQSSIVNIQKAEQVQSSKNEHLLAMQYNIDAERKKQIEEEKKKVVETKESDQATVRDKKEEDKEKRKGHYSLYTKKKKKKGLDTGNVLDKEA